MFRETKKQTDFFFMSFNLTQRKQKKMDQSWAAAFNETIFNFLLRFENQFRELFHACHGRPNLSVAALLGILILKHEMDLTDEMTVEQFNFNMLWHKALGVSSYNANLCRKTLHNFQKRLLDSQKHEKLFDELTSEIIKKANLNISNQRLDSVHIKSDMAHLGRVRLFSRTLELFLKQLKKKLKDRFDDIPEELVNKYLDREGYFCDPKPSESHNKSIEIAADIYVLVKGYSHDEDVKNLKGYQLLERILREHCKFSEGQLELIKAGSDSLQNPSDEQASFSGHKGQGYQMQTTETCHEENPFEVITSVQVEGAHHSDQNAVGAVLDQLKAVDLKPEVMSADAGYGSQENVDFCQEHEVELLSPVSGKDPASSLEDFTFCSETGEMVSCPNGEKPVNQRYRKNREKWEAEFILFSQCNECPHQANCPGKILKKGIRKITWTQANREIAQRRKFQKTEEFKTRYKIRSGIEATFSQLKNTHGADRLSARGHPMVELVMTLKCTALNVHRYLKNVRFWKRIPPLDKFRTPVLYFSVFKLKIAAFFTLFGPFVIPRTVFR